MESIKKISAQDMLQKLVEASIKHGNTGMTIVLAVCDDEGIATTIHRSEALEVVVPAHTERTLICLAARLYGTNLAPDMNPRIFRIGDPDDEETRQ